MAEDLRRRRGRRLSAALVRNVSKPGKYHDGGGLGLYLRVEKSGARFWVQRLTIGGKRRELGLGSPPVVTLAEAREKALDNKRMAARGLDPLAEKRKAEGVPSFAEAARRVWEMHRPTWRNPKHAAQFISTLETYAFPRLGDRPVSDIGGADVLAVLTPIWTGKPETARRVKQRISAVMKWAVAQGLRADNPAEAITRALPKVAPVKAHRRALPYADVARCLEAVRGSEALTATKLALEFLVLTATRSGEVRGARWEEVDFEAAVWTIPPERMKAKRPHRVPLSPRAVAVLREAERLADGSGLIFPGARHGRPLSDMTLSKLVKSLGFEADIHGFRTSFRTWAQEQTNFPREVAEAALAHNVGDAVERAYARSDVFEKRRRLMESWASWLEARRGEVVALRR